VAQIDSRNLQQATNEFLRSLQQGNSNLRSRGGLQRSSVGGRTALTISLSNVNEATGRPEVVNVITTQLRSGELLFLIAVAPNDEYSNYQGVFQNVLRSLRLSD